DTIITAVYYDGNQKVHYIKRFMIETSTVDKKFLFISDSKGSKLLLASVDQRPRLKLTIQRAAKGEFETEELLAETMVDVRGWRAIGNKINAVKIKEAVWLEPLEVPEPELQVQPDEPVEEEAVVTEETPAATVDTTEPADLTPQRDEA